MADPNLGQLAASVWEKKIGKKPSDNIFNSRALIYALNKEGFKEEVDGGRLVEFSLEFATNTTHKSVGEFEQLDTSRIDVFDAARFEWKIVAGTVIYSELERLRAQASAGKFDVIAEKMENSKDSHLNELNTQFWSDGTGNSGKDIGGLQLIIATAPTTGTVGGINRGNFSFHRNQQASGIKTSTAYDNLVSVMRTVHNQCSSGGVKEMPTSAICGRATFEGYEGRLTVNERYTYDTSRQVGRKGDAAFLNDALRFKQIPIFYDEAAVTDAVYFLNPKYLKVPYLSGAWMKMYPAVDPANQLANVHKLATICTMGTNNSRRLGVVTAIT